MLKTLAVWLIGGSTLVAAASGPAVTKAYIDGKGSIHIITSDGHDQTIRPAKWQNGGGFEDIDVAPDGRTVGWVVNQMLNPFEGGTNYAYEVGANLSVWRDGKVLRKFEPGLIRDWVFLKKGAEVAIHTGPTHGQQFYDCMRYDVATGKELEHWNLDRRDYVVPEWAKPLLVNDPPPGPEDISDWFPDHPTNVKKAAPKGTGPKKQ